MPTFAPRHHVQVQPPVTRHRRFSASDGSRLPARTPRLRHTGAGNSIRPFARSQRRLRHHCEVHVPGLYLRFHAENRCGSVRSPAPSLRPVSRPNRGGVNAETRFPLPSSTPRTFPRSPLPVRSSCENPQDPSVQSAPNSEARLTRLPMASYSPRLPLSILPRITA